MSEKVLIQEQFKELNHQLEIIGMELENIQNETIPRIKKTEKHLSEAFAFQESLQTSFKNYCKEMEKQSFHEPDWDSESDGEVFNIGNFAKDKNLLFQFYVWPEDKTRATKHLILPVSVEPVKDLRRFMTYYTICDYVNGQYFLEKRVSDFPIIQSFRRFEPTSDDVEIEPSQNIVTKDKGRPKSIVIGLNHYSKLLELRKQIRTKETKRST